MMHIGVQSLNGRNRNHPMRSRPFHFVSAIEQCLCHLFSMHGESHSSLIFAQHRCDHSFQPNQEGSCLWYLWYTGLLQSVSSCQSGFEQHLHVHIGMHSGVASISIDQLSELSLYCQSAVEQHL